MLQRTGKQNQINFLEQSENSKSVKNEVKKETENEAIQRIAKEQKSKKLDNRDNGLKNSKSVFSTGYNGENELVNSPKYLGCENSTSIFGEKQKENNINDDFTPLNISLKEKIANKKNDRLNKENTQTASSSKVVFAKEDKKTYDFDKVTNNVSIFDTDFFSKIPEKTDGEKLADNKKKKEKISKDQKPLKAK
ncbi:MAG: hypothetical protein R6T91_04735, partial [Bacteroidales bacterium]